MIDLTSQEGEALTQAQRDLIALIEYEPRAPKRDAYWDQLFEITEELNRRHPTAEEAA